MVKWVGKSSSALVRHRDLTQEEALCVGEFMCLRSAPARRISCIGCDGLR